tara:strand:- start:2949 stop:5174 length:2226 start_codon:yes stop_codon:yes gene_type:complete
MNDKYSRQIQALGKNTQKTIREMRILIVGLNTIGSEICKNLALSGISSIYLYDSNPIHEDNYLYNFFLSYPEKIGIGVRHDEGIKNNIEKLVEKINIYIYNKNSCPKSFDYIFLTNAKESINYWNIYAREVNARFAAAYQYGNETWAWFDPNENAISSSPNGETSKIWDILQNTDNILIVAEVPTDIYENCRVLVGNATQNIICTVKVLNNTWVEIDSILNWSATFIQSIPDQLCVSGKIYENDVINRVFISNNICFPLSIKLAAQVSHECLKIFTQTPLVGEIYEDNNSLINDESLYIKDLDHNNPILIVGAGAIGCEYLKNLGTIGFKKIIIIDSDAISISNTTRQLFYQDNDVGKSKVLVAAEKMRRTFPDIEIFPIECFLNKETFNNIGINWNSIQIILNAVDNTEARVFIDELSIYYKIPTIDSGTLACKAHAQFILPNYTESYNDLQDEQQNNEIPVCTVKEFPYKIEHCVAWARELLEIILASKKTGSSLCCKYFVTDIKHLINSHPQEFWEKQRKPAILLPNNPLRKLWIDSTDNIRKIKNIDANNDLITSWLIITSKLRATNYNLHVENEDSITKILYNITPALQTTTAYIIGHACYHMLYAPVKNIFVNLAINLSISSDPNPSIKITSKDNDHVFNCPRIAIPENHTKWDCIIHEINEKEDITSTKIIEYIEKQYQINVLTIRNINGIAYSEMIASDQKFDINKLWIIDAMSKENNKIIQMPYHKFIITKE